jgi:hypothetical protein
MPPITRQQAKQDVIDATDAALAALKNQDAKLQAEIFKIDRIKVTRLLTAEEQQKRDDLRAAQKECRDAIFEASYDQLQALDDSDEVKRLNAAFQSINVDLKSALKRVEKIVGDAQTIVKVLAAVAEVAAKLAQYALI